MNVELINVGAFVLATSSLFFVICDGPKIIFGVTNFSNKKFSILLFTTVFIFIISQPIISISIDKINNYQVQNLKDKEAYEKRKEVEENYKYQKNNTDNNTTFDENSNSFEGTNETKYETRKDGEIYESEACSLCEGTGYEKGRNMATGETEARICPMCEGKGVRSY